MVGLETRGAAVWRGISLSATSAVILALAVSAPSRAGAQTACAGAVFATFQTPADPRPQIRLEVGGVLRPVLIDTGATASILYDDTREKGSRVDLGVAGLGDLRFTVEPNTSASSNERDGAVLGTDLLSRAGVVFSASGVELSAAPCDPTTLLAAGMRRIDQTGFFASPSQSHPGPNVPVLPIAIGDLETIAQLDTGYDDSIYPYSVDINQPLLATLRAHGMTLTPKRSVIVTNCLGLNETREVYATPASLRLGAPGQPPLAVPPTFVLIPKSPNSCGGIADMNHPAAQLSARFLNLFEAVALDGPGQAIWVKPK